MNDGYKKNTTLLIVVLLMGIVIIGGTFAYFTYGLNATNDSYVSRTECFDIVYNNGNDITGTLFPSSGPLKGLNGSVSLKVSDSCNIYGTATLKLHVDSSVDEDITKNVSSYCISRKTLEKIDGISTKEACTTANGRWMGYSDDYCENPQTLERIAEYNNETSCTTNGGSWITWTSSISPLKYAVYSDSADILPKSVGYITSSDIGNDIIINNNISVSNTQKNIYIYIWLDGYLTDNSINDLPFSGYISSSVTQRSSLTAYETISKTIKTDTIDWTVIPTTAQSGVYKTTQDNVDIYYYRGNVNNNNVLYGGYCWKIVRTTKTGGTKIIYNGLPDANNHCGTNTTTSQSGDLSVAKLSGTTTTYAFDSTSPYSADYRQSTIKPLIDTWLDNNIGKSLLEPTDFCIDLDIYAGKTTETVTYYNPEKRFYDNRSNGPTLECSTGNTLTSYVGLLTMDEVWYAGGVAANNTYYLYNNKEWWQLSPRYLNSSSAFVFYVGSSGDLRNQSGIISSGIRPVVSLASGVKLRGEGTYDDPYIPSFPETISAYEDPSGANPPELTSGMVPVKLNENGTVVMTVDPVKSNDWYDYSEQKWANAVLVDSSVRSNYIDSSGNIIPDVSVDTEKILAYYVWIPRYKYTFSDNSTQNPYPEQSIDIVFEGKNDPRATGGANGPNDYYTHPAFTWNFTGNTLDESTPNLGGVWVGKFELSIATGSLDCTSASCGTNANNIRILPNKTSLRYGYRSSFLNGIRSMQQSDNSFGLPTDITIADSHMMKNRDWGAVAYLAHSAYGLGNQAVRTNSYSSYLTGCGASEDNKRSESSCYDPYGKNITSSPSTTGDISTYPQSTTGNITGVFDISGGTIEYVTGNYYIGGDDFFDSLALKYFDIYTVSDYSSCTFAECGGHALMEIAGWHNNYTNFVSSTYPYFTRGGANNYYDTGSFYFGHTFAEIHDTETGTRAVVVVS